MHRAGGDIHMQRYAHISEVLYAKHGSKNVLGVLVEDQDLPDGRAGR